MKITRKMMHPELRTIGMIMKKFTICRSEAMLRFNNRFLDKFGAGKAFTRKVAYKQHFIERADGTKLRICIYMPKELEKRLKKVNETMPEETFENKNGQVPGLLWMHGGGYAIGIPEQDISFIEGFIKATSCVVVSPDYIRATDAPYPAALHDCYTALSWMWNHCEELGINPSKVAIGGDSAGGGLSAALSLYARDKGDISVAFQMPLYPMLDYRPTKTSRNNDAPVWNTKSNNAAWKMYLGDTYGTDKVSKYACPSLETDYRNLPPTLTYVGSIEPFRDETIAYARNLKAAGVPVKCRIFKGCFHGFDTMCGYTKVAKKAREYLFENFKEAMTKE